MIYIIKNFIGRTPLREQVLEGPPGIDIKARYKEWAESQIGKFPALEFVNHEAKLEILQARLDWRIKEEQLKVDDFITTIKELKPVDYYEYRYGPMIVE